MAALQRLASVDAALDWLRARGVRSLGVDSRRVAAGDAFIAWPGHAVDGRRFVPQAFEAGAVAALVEDDGAAIFAGLHTERHDAARVATVAGLKAATGEIASRWLAEPSRSLRVVACTGTNGKTSMAWWTAQALAGLGQRCGVVGTLGAGEPPLDDRPSSVVSTGLTTPDPVTLQTALRRFVDTGVTAVAIEASSIGIVEHRLAGTAIEVALFSNFTQDHLDYHGSMAAYWQAKARLFRWPGLRAASINIDDAQGRRLAADLLGSEPPAGEAVAGEPAAVGAALDVWTCSAQGAARLSAGNIGYRDGGLSFEVVERGAPGSAAPPPVAILPVSTRLIGDYNVGNLLVMLGGLRALGVPLAAAVAVCGRLTPVPGRMQRVSVATGEPEVVVDYAHTPDALEKALGALRPFAQERGGRLWCVFGCGGDRDAGKRPLMGAIAARLADRVVVTTDNPRGESPAAIIEQIVAGIHRAALPGAVDTTPNRASAIASAIQRADGADVILIAGKGHEAWQEVAGEKLPFADADEALAALRRRAGIGTGTGTGTAAADAVTAPAVAVAVAASAVAVAVDVTAPVGAGTAPTGAAP